MKKKLVALGLILSLTLSVSAVAFGNTNDADSEAGIDFVDGIGDDDQGVYDPYDPNVPTPPTDPGFWDSLQSIDLYFGEHDRAMTDMSYHSYYDGGTRAGMAVVSRFNGWVVNVSISEFTLETDAYTLDGFDMNMHEHAVVEYGNSSINTNNINIAADVSADIASGSRGFMGADFNAILNVVGGTDDEGHAQADLFWAFIPGQPS
ncbi:MAG: WxL domain-containing protein [Defluviitaleaceae bacterium]|nr:WxL domain-containing protein [Defluviitaleaceae bacterium]